MKSVKTGFNINFFKANHLVDKIACMKYSKHLIVASLSLILNLVFIFTSAAQPQTSHEAVSTVPNSAHPIAIISPPSEPGKQPMIRWLLPGGQPPPPPNLLPLTCNYDDCGNEGKNPRPVLIIKNLTPAEKASYWDDRVLDSNGVIALTRAMDGSLTVIDRMFTHSTKKNIFAQASNQLSKKVNPNITVISELKEQIHRTNYFITSPTGVAMLTVWDVQADGGQITTPRDALNVKIRDSDASLILLKGGESSKKRLWNLDWAEKNTYFELQIPDEIQANGKTRLTKDDVIGFAKKITQP